jgi:hypothetical protein
MFEFLPQPVKSIGTHTAMTHWHSTLFTQRWSDLVGPLLFICSCALSAISGNRSRTRTITTDFTDGTDKIIREIRGQKSGRSVPSNAAHHWRGPMVLE